jgi:hypothetical protein
MGLLHAPWCAFLVKFLLLGAEAVAELAYFGPLSSDI